VLKLAKLLQADENELLTLWLAGQIYELIKNEQVAKNAIKFIDENI
jgi:hypothetical protein